MTKFSDANLSGAEDQKVQRKHNYLIELLNRGWQRVWTQDNDGSGSTLDADLLDGNHGAYYLPVASYTAADVLAKLLTVDGAGSLLDADKLDGIEAASFVRSDACTIDNNAGISYLNDYAMEFDTNSTGSTGFPSELGATVLFSSASYARDFALYKATTSQTSLWFSAIDATRTGFVNWYKLWTDGNDGAGSTLDADLLDGLEATTFYRRDRITMSASAEVSVISNENIGFQQNGLGSTGYPTEYGYTWFFAGGSQTRDFAIHKTGATESPSLYVGVSNTARDGFAAWYKLWNAGNDGTGSGLDADLLDGNEAAAFLLLTGGTMAGNLTFADGVNIVVNTTTGTKIGTGTTQKLGFFNATPVVQRTTYTQTYSTASKTVPAPTAATLTDSSGGTANTTLEVVGTTYSQTVVRNNFADLAAMVNKNMADTLAIFKVVTALIDDLQALGFVA